MKMQIIKLDNSSRRTLEQMYRKDSKFTVRTRAHSLLLSDDGNSIPEISGILKYSPRTIYRWFRQWKCNSFKGLYDLPGRGRKPILKIEDRNKLQELIEKEPRKLQDHQAYFKGELGVNISKTTLKRALRSMGYTWKRMRKWLGKSRNEEDFRKAMEEIEVLKKLEDKGDIELYYCDESGFNLTPSVPYGWQKTRERICLPSAKSPNYNVLGFMKRDSSLYAFGFQCTINSQVALRCMDDFCQQRIAEWERKGKKPPKAYVIIDNAPIHNSNLFRDQESRWEKMGVFIKRLPTYSPELNLIEILWKKIKYEWLPLNAYSDMDKLTQSVNEVVRNVGSKFVINFA